MKKNLVIILLLSFVLPLANAKPPQKWMHCVIVDMQDIELYKYCCVYAEKIKYEQKRLIIARLSADPKINPICVIDFIDENNAVYSTNFARDTVEIEALKDENEKQIMKIIFEPSAQKKDLKIILSKLK